MLAFLVFCAGFILVAISRGWEATIGGAIAGGVLQVINLWRTRRVGWRRRPETEAQRSRSAGTTVAG
jgi:hypothetical protein